MPINWSSGLARVAIAVRWVYFAICALILATVFSDEVRQYHPGENYSGRYVWEWQRTPTALFNTLIAAFWCAATYFALKYLFRGLRWIGAGFVAPKP